MRTIFAAALTDDVAKFDSVIASDFYIFDGGARFNGDSVTAFIKAQHAAGKPLTNPIGSDEKFIADSLSECVRLI